MFWFLMIFVSFILCEERTGIDVARFSKDMIELRDALMELNKRMEEIDFRVKKLISDIEVLNTRIRGIGILPELKLEQEKIKNDIIELNKKLESLTTSYESLKIEMKKEKEEEKKGLAFKNLEEFIFSPKFNIITFSVALFSLLIAIFS